MKHGHRWFVMALVLVTLVAVAFALWGLPARAVQAQGGTTFVDADATGANDGTSWEDAYSTLQPALEEAAEGDEIWVAEGAYTPTHEFSPGDPRSATFQLKNGVAIYGGFDPSVGETGWEDRDWKNNVTTLSGDIGIQGDPADNSYHVFYHPYELALDGSAVLDGFTVTGGNADGWSNWNGGGMYNESSSPAVTNCAFSGNSSSNGGGMFNDSSSPEVTSCTFAGNSAVYYGGGMFNGTSSPVVTNCTFASNSARQGGGMHNVSSSLPAVTNCTFSGNSADLGGGMFNYDSSSPTLTNCTFSGNSAQQGGGVWNGRSSPAVTNCTFSGNSLHGMHNYLSSPTVTNCILWGDGPGELYNEQSEPVVTYSDVQGGYPGEGNIEEDPLFVGSGGGEYHLGEGSPCVDAGTNDAPNLPILDFEGDHRVMDGDWDGSPVVDMGIDEAWWVPPDVICVDQDATGNNDGTSWEDAYTALQPALDEAAESNQIWVAQGTYTPSYEFEPGDPRSATFQLKNGVGLYGGFDPSVGDIGWQDRDWVNNATILSGDIGVHGDPADNSYHVFYHPSELALDGSAVLDGFRITGGNANDFSGSDFAGGGMCNFSSSPTLTNCTFSQNSAYYGGGAMYNETSSPAVIRCTFSDNSATGYGGAMLNWESSPVVTNCTFSGNSADLGGGMCNDGLSSPTVINCTFTDNAARFGGGIINLDSSSPALGNCTFASNSATGYGGAMSNWESSPVVTNCTFSGNSAGVAGGALRNNYSSSPAVTNCILWGDSPHEISNDSSEPVVIYSDIQGGYPGEGNIDADPLFADPDIGDYHLSPGSPCIDAGTNDAPNLPDYDFEGDPRVMDGNRDGVATVDMGVDEVYGYAVYLPTVFRAY